MNVYDPEKQSTKFDDLLVADTALQCIKYVPNISCLWRYPRETFFFTSLILCLIMSKNALVSSHSHWKFASPMNTN